MTLTRSAAIIGTAYSAIGRHLDRPAGALALDAIRAAADEAGIQPQEIDGLSVFPSLGRIEGGEPDDGVDFVGPQYVATALGIRRLRWSCSVGPGSFVASIIEAANALAAGDCDYAVAWKAMHNPTGTFGRYVAVQASGPEQFTAPYGLSDNITPVALPYSAYMHQYGARREHMATFAVLNRKNASKNPDAVFYEKPISREDYLSSRMVIEPLSLLDCDMPVDGAGAAVLCRADRAKDHCKTPIYIVGKAAIIGRYGNGTGFDLEAMQANARSVASSLWETCALGPNDVNVANLYDGFSFFTYLWLEGLGFCKEGEAWQFIQDGRIEPGGDLPLNTSGGSLGMGRLHGPAQVIESVRQLQGCCGERQLEGVEVALSANGNPGKAPAAILLSTEML